MTKQSHHKVHLAAVLELSTGRPHKLLKVLFYTCEMQNGGAQLTGLNIR